jgi:ABC-2 type transport system permease protein
MLRVGRLALLLFVTVLKRRLAYRGDLLLQGVDELARCGVNLALLEVYLSQTTNLHGWNHAELLFVLGFSMIPISFFHCLCGNLYSLSSSYIIQGNLDRVLLRPYPSFLQICFDRIAIEDLSGAVFGAVLMAFAAARIDGFSCGIGHLLMLALLLASAFTVVVSVFMTFAASGFWFEDRVGMVPPVYNLMEFGRWPSRIYHPVLRWFISAVIPFSFVAFYPASFFVRGPGDMPLYLALLTPAVAAVSLMIATAVWRMGIRRYNSTGS